MIFLTSEQIESLLRVGTSIAAGLFLHWILTHKKGN